MVATFREEDKRDFDEAGSKNWSVKDTRRGFFDSFNSPTPLLRLRFKIDGEVAAAGGLGS